MIYMFKVIHYCLPMRFKISEINVLKYMNLILLFICTWISMQACLKKTGVTLELLTNNDILMMDEKEIRGGICST